MLSSKKKRGRPPKGEAKPKPKWHTKLSHPTYIIEECPNCGFPEADGGYCDECGWTRPHPLKDRR